MTGSHTPSSRVGRRGVHLLCWPDVGQGQGSEGPNEEQNDWVRDWRAWVVAGPAFSKASLDDLMSQSVSHFTLCLFITAFSQFVTRDSFSCFLSFFPGSLRVFKSRYHQFTHPQIPSTCAISGIYYNRYCGFSLEHRKGKREGKRERNVIQLVISCNNNLERKEIKVVRWNPTFSVSPSSSFLVYL